jgi:hypothetical protein
VRGLAFSVALALVFGLTTFAEAATPMRDLDAVLEQLSVDLEVRYRPSWPGPPTSRLEVVLAPQAGLDGSHVVSFGLPFGPGWLDDDALIRVTGHDGAEIPVFTEPLASWWIDGDKRSLRSVLVQFEAAFESADPLRVTITWDGGRTCARPEKTPVTQTQVSLRLDPPPGFTRAESFDYRCPKVLAMLPADWLCASLIVWQQVPVAANRVAPWFDEHLTESFEGSLRTISGTEFSVHLFDRPATYAKMYVRSGEKEHLLAALQSIDFYLQHLGPDGFFDLKSYKDVKYVFTEGFAVLYMLTGDERFLDGIDRALKAWETHTRIEYRGEGFWTERHHGFGMMAYLHAYEISGDRTLLDKARRYFEAAHSMQIEPRHGGRPDGSWARPRSSGGERGPEAWISSPWMSAFLADAIWKYWMLTGDPRAPASLAMYAKFTQRRSVAPAGDAIHYLTASEGYGDSRAAGSDSHNMEGIYLLAIGYYLSGGSDQGLLHPIGKLWAPMMGSDANVPPRQFTWRFRETSMLVWFLASAGH